MSTEKATKPTLHPSNNKVATPELFQEVLLETSHQTKKSSALDPSPPILLRGMLGGKKIAQEKVQQHVHLALLIDVDEFEPKSGLPSLPGSHADATILREILCTEANGYAPWAEGSFSGCHAKSPTYRRLQTKIEEFIKQSQRYEIASVFVYISTHGFIESDGLHFCMADTQFQQGRISRSLRFQDLKRWLAPLSKHPFVMMIDSCRSSSEAEEQETNSPFPKAIIPKRDDVALNGFKNWAVLTAAEHGQSAHEIKNPRSSEFFQSFQQKHQVSLKEQHGIFTLTFLDVLLEEKFKEAGIYQVIMETNRRMKPICEHYQIEQTARCYLEAGLNIEVVSPRTLKMRIPTMEELHQASNSPTPSPQNEKYPPSYTPAVSIPAVSSSSIRGFSSSLEDDHFNVSGTAKQPKNWFIEGPENSFIQTDSEFIEYSEIRSEFDLKKTNTTAKEPFDSIIPDFLDLSSSQKSEITPPALESLSSVLFDKTPQTSNQPSILDTFVDQDNSPDWLELSMLTSEARKAAIAALKADWLAEHERLIRQRIKKSHK